MKKIIIPSAIVLLVAVVALAFGAFTSDSRSAAVKSSEKECTRTATVASVKECGDKARATMVSEKKECGTKATATKASASVECPHSGAVLKTDSERKSCGEKATTVHASAEKAGKDEACCEKHAMALAE